MTELRADPLSPIDAATLWPQLRRLGTEVVATRAGENLLLSSGLAATGLTHLPRMPRTVVVGLRRGLNYRGVLGRELAGGAGWELVSLRLVRDKDDEAVVALLNSAAQEAAARGGRTLYLRMAEGSPHMMPVRRAGFVSYHTELLHALPAGRTVRETSTFRPAARPDRHGVFRLYCRAVPEHVRRYEAPTSRTGVRCSALRLREGVRARPRCRSRRLRASATGRCASSPIGGSRASLMPC
jgi:hypothetical protein